MNDQKVCILGMGYVGLTLAVVMAEKGFMVYGAEINPKILNSIRQGIPHFYEQSLEVRLKRVLANGTLKFVERVKEIPANDLPSMYILTVGTPLDENHRPRMDMVANVAREVADSAPDGSLVVLRSTVRLGTTRNVVIPALEASGKKFQVGYCPERTLEGKALEELSYLPQIVGGFSDADAWRAAQVFQRITPTIIRVSSLETAEIIKLLDNSFRDLFFAFGNEVALMCDAAGLDGIEVIRAANTGYERTNIALPGFVGGPCLHKDPHILQDALSQYNHVPEMIKTARALNEGLSKNIIEMILREVPRDKMPAKPVITICGLAFKGRPETDDTRATPAIELIDALKEYFPGAELRGQDFAVKDEGIEELGLVAKSIDGAFKEANIVIIANNNSKYQWVNLDALAASMAKPGIVFDVWSVLPMSVEAQVEGVMMRRFGSARNWSQKA